jgi:hypothetical protein
MNHRKLRIAWSVAWGSAGLLLIALWVRSYSWFDSFGMSFDGQNSYWLGSVVGEMRFATPMTHSQGIWWHTYDTPAKEWVKDELPKRSVVGFWAGQSGIIVPHWFFVMVCTATAALPWMSFSLRTLLIATTILAVGLGWTVCTLRQ